MKKYFFNFGIRSTSDFYGWVADSAHQLPAANLNKMAPVNTHQGIALRFPTSNQPQAAWESPWDTSSTP